MDAKGDTYERGEDCTHEFVLKALFNGLVAEWVCKKCGKINEEDRFEEQRSPWRKLDKETVTNRAKWGNGNGGGTVAASRVVASHAKSDQYYTALLSGDDDFAVRELKTWLCKICHIPQRPALKEFGHKLTDRIASVALEELKEKRMVSLIGYHEIGRIIKSAINEVEKADPTVSRFVNWELLRNLIEGNRPAGGGRV